MTTQTFEAQVINEEELTAIAGGIDRTGTNTCLFPGQAPDGHELVFNGYGDPIGFQKIG